MSGNRNPDGGADEVLVGGVRYRCGAAVRVAAGPGTDPGFQGRTGVIDALHRDGSGRVFLLVCLDEAPGEDEPTRIYVNPAEVDLIG